MSTPELPLRVAGYSAALSDLNTSVRARAPRMIGAVFLAMFVLLFLAFGSVTLPLKAMLMNSLSLTASFGAIVWVFQDGRLVELLGYEPTGTIDATLPLVMFAAVFGLSMDYELLILARVREEYDKSGDNTDAVARGLAATGRLVTSAAALLVLVAAAFSTSSILFVKSIGVGIALAVALDATVVRALLVPATMKVMGRWNWWAPASWTRWWRGS
jgi:RND superfamily putative drug exporter